MRNPIALMPADPLTVRAGAIGWASDGLRATFATIGAADYRGVTKGAGARWYGSPADRDFS